MKYKITIEVDSNILIGEEGSKEVKKMLMLAQSGLIQKYADRLISAGSMQNGSFYPVHIACTYVELRDEEKKET